MAINPITLARPVAGDAALRRELDDALVRELLSRSKGATLGLLAATGLLWMIVGAWAGAFTIALLVALASVVSLRLVGVLWLERGALQRFRTGVVFSWFATMNLLLGACLGGLVLLCYPVLPPARVAMVTACLIGINGAALVAMGASPLVYLLYCGTNMAAQAYACVVHPVAGLEHEIQACNLVYAVALVVMMRAVHRSLRSSIVLRLRLGASLRELSSAQAELVDASREAGRADVARTVLHNVGNALNSVNVSASLVTDVVSHSRTTGLLKVIAMVTQHREDFSRFFREDPRAAKLGDYCAQLAETVERENHAVTSELEALARNIDHIKVIVSAQQSHVKSRGSVEVVEVPALLDDALRFSASTAGPEDIEVVRRFDELPPAILDRHKALQILVNLLANARDAVLANGAGARRIVVHARRGAAGTLEIAVEDSGCGIARHDLEKIFVLGFTTKEHGQGLGLHFSACAARELHGTLTAHSPGLGHGASFVLALPFRAGGHASAA